MSDIGVIYIARGKDPNWGQRIGRFAASWEKHPPGVDCQLYIIYKEFSTIDDLTMAADRLDKLRPVNIVKYIPWNSWGGGCFQEACNHVREKNICTLVSTTEIMHDNWLARLWTVYNAPNTGLVGCTGSHVGNLHIRDTAIIIDRDFYVGVSKQFDFTTSKDGYLDFEHGPNNLTIQVMRAGKEVYVVEKERYDGGVMLAMPPEGWTRPTTYQGNLENVLVHDRGARDFNDL